MEMTDVLAAMAWRITQKVAAADIPFVSSEIPMTLDHDVSCLLLATGEVVAPSVKHNGSWQLWVQPVTARILVPMRGETPQEFNLTRRLLPLVWDTFPVVPGGAQALFVGSPLQGHIDRCLPIVPRFDREITFGQSNRFAVSEIEFDVKFHRSPAGVQP